MRSKSLPPPLPTRPLFPIHSHNCLIQMLNQEFELSLDQFQMVQLITRHHVSHLVDTIWPSQRLFSVKCWDVSWNGEVLNKGGVEGGFPQVSGYWGGAILCDGAVGTTRAGWAAGLISRAGGAGCELDPSADFPLLCTTLEGLAHLCCLAVLQDWNLHPQVRHSHWCWGSWAALAASLWLSLSCFTAWLRFHARHHFSFWALLALQLPFWSSKKAIWPSQFSSSKTNTNITFFTLATGTGWGTSAITHLTRWAWKGEENSTQEMFLSSAFWAEMTLVKRWLLERNQWQWKVLRMLNTDSLTPLGEDVDSLTWPFSFWAGVWAITVSTGEWGGLEGLLGQYLPQVRDNGGGRARKRRKASHR